MDPDVEFYVDQAVAYYRQSYPRYSREQFIEKALDAYFMEHGEPARDVNLAVRWWVDREVTEVPNLADWFVLR
jgi:hypothetical protein